MQKVFYVCISFVYVLRASALCRCAPTRNQCANALKRAVLHVRLLVYSSIAAQCKNAANRV